MRLSIALLAAIVAAGISLPAQQEVTVRPVFDRSADLSAWELDGSGTWEIGRGLLILAKPGTPSGPIRRPAAIAVLKTPPLVRVTFDVSVRSTAPVDVVYRDMQIVFGYESSTRFYYVHLSAITDDVHNGVFIVNAADRRRIDGGRTPPQLEDQDWHRVRLERDGASGRIRIFVDAAAAPAFDLVDTTIRAGRVGLGSFDDTGEFRDVVVTGRQ